MTDNNIEKDINQSHNINDQQNGEIQKEKANINQQSQQQEKQEMELETKGSQNSQGTTSKEQQQTKKPHYEKTFAGELSFQSYRSKAEEQQEKHTIGVLSSLLLMKTLQESNVDLQGNLGFDGSLTDESSLSTTMDITVSKQFKQNTSLTYQGGVYLENKSLRSIQNEIGIKKQFIAQQLYVEGSLSALKQPTYPFSYGQRYSLKKELNAITRLFGSYDSRQKHLNCGFGFKF